MMNQEDLKKLKAGDQIAISGLGYGSMQLKTVDKITPTGRIKLINGETHNNQGRSMGEHYHHSYICTVEEYNKEEEKKRLTRERAGLLREINEICINKNISAENLRRVLDILKE
jgi:hypothetical protein